MKINFILGRYVGFYYSGNMAEPNMVKLGLLHVIYCNFCQGTEC